MNKVEFNFADFKTAFESVNALSNKKGGEEEFVVIGKNKISKLTAAAGAGVFVEIPDENLFGKVETPLAVSATTAAKFLNYPNVDDTLTIEKNDKDEVTIESGAARVEMSGVPTFAQPEEDDKGDIKPVKLFRLKADVAGHIMFALIGTKKSSQQGRSHMQVRVEKTDTYGYTARFRASDSFGLTCVDSEVSVIDANDETDAANGVVLHEEMWRHICASVTRHEADTIAFAETNNIYEITISANKGTEERARFTVSKFAEDWHLPEERVEKILTNIGDTEEPSSVGEIRLDDNEKSSLLSAFKFLDSISENDAVSMIVSDGEVTLNALANSKNAKLSVKIKDAKGNGEEVWINTMHFITLLSSKYDIALSCLPGGFRYTAHSGDNAARLRLYAAPAK